MRKPNQNQSTELYLEEKLLIKILWECELLGNNDDFLLLQGSSDPFPKYSSVICGLFLSWGNEGGGEERRRRKRGGRGQKKAGGGEKEGEEGKRRKRRKGRSHQSCVLELWVWRYNCVVFLDPLPAPSLYQGAGTAEASVSAFLFSSSLTPISGHCRACL